MDVQLKPFLKVLIFARNRRSHLRPLHEPELCGHQWRRHSGVYWAYSEAHWSWTEYRKI